MQKRVKRNWGDLSPWQKVAVVIIVLAALAAACYQSLAGGA